MENIKTCRFCKKEFSRLPKTSYKRWEGQFCCSKECAWASRDNYWLVKHQIKKGQRLSPNTEFKKGKQIAEENIQWKGEYAGYIAKHDWARRHFGRPQFCEHCKTSAKRMYHWANISKKFLRDRSDWLRLCVPCHKIFDLDRIDNV